MPHEVLEATATTQTKAIYQHLKAGNRLTPLRALKLFGCLRLAARIHDIRKGNGVKQTWVKRELTPVGEGKHVATYYI